jgi:hypothetical protein
MFRWESTIVTAPMPIIQEYEKTTMPCKTSLVQECEDQSSIMSIEALYVECVRSEMSVLAIVDSRKNTYALRARCGCFCVLAIITIASLRGCIRHMRNACDAMLTCMNVRALLMMIMKDHFTDWLSSIASLLCQLRADLLRYPRT